MDLCIAMSIAFALLLLNVFVNFSGSLRDFFASYSRFPITALLVNCLFFWLVLLLWLAFRRWREAIRRREEFEDILSSISPDALVVADRNRTIVMCNSSVRRILGYAEDDVINQKTDLLYYDRRTSKEYPREIYEALKKDGFHIGTAIGRKKEGGTVPLEIISGELPGRGGVVLLLRDISERICMEEERGKLEIRALQARKLESLGVLAGGIAHDFNNYLMIIQGHTDLTLLNLPPSSAARESILEIGKTANRAADLCAHLLSYSGKGAIVFHPVDLSRIAREAGQMLSRSMPGSAVVEFHLPPDLPAVEGDEAQLHQVAMNLIRNALESLAEQNGTVTISAGVRKCEEAALSDTCTGMPAPPGRYVYLEVKDTGCGMSAETRLRVCEPFFTAKPNGHGMGLAAVLGIVRAHKGALRVESSLGVGSTFTVLIPCGGAVGSASASISSNAAKSAGDVQ